MNILYLVFLLLGFSSYTFSHACPPCEVVVKVNINTANALVLMHAFKGIGKQRAEAIVHYREAHGEFNSVAELAQVKKIGLNFIKQHLLELEDVFTVRG